MIITRKIQIAVACEDKEMKNAYYEQLHQWRFICRKAANLLSSHLFTQDNIKDYVYLSDGIKVKLADINKDEEGILSTSYQNSGYQMLSHLFKGQIPMSIITGLNALIHKTYKEEKTEYFSGERSLRNYRKTIPIPISGSHAKLREYDGGVLMDIYNIPFVMLFGRDRSGNRDIVDRCMAGEVKFCGSSIKYDQDKKKWFLLMCLEMPKTGYKPKKDKEMTAELSIEYPIVARAGKKEVQIGNKEEFLYRRIQIQAAMKRLQVALRYAEGGKGRKSKLQALDRYHLKEKNYISTQLHRYSNLLVLEAKRQKAGTIVLLDQLAKEDEAREDKFLLRNWSYYGLKEKITYKADRENIKILVR